MKIIQKYTLYEDNRLMEIRNYRGIHNKVYHYNLSLISSRKWFRISTNRYFQLDSFIFNNSGILERVLSFDISNSGQLDLMTESVLSYNERGELISKEFHFPNYDFGRKLFYSWSDGNNLGLKSISIDNHLDVERIRYTYDNNDNYLCLEVVDPDEPVSKNNWVSYSYSDGTGSFDGTTSIENEIEYNHVGLPVRIVSTYWGFLPGTLTREIYYSDR